MSEPKPDVTTRDIATYLFGYGSVLMSQSSLMALLGETGAEHALALHVKAMELDKLARWLDSADFLVVDPFAYRLVCELLVDGMSTDLEFYRGAARAALSGELMADFIKGRTYKNDRP